MEFLVYLAGPIKGKSYKSATEWREEAADTFKSAGGILHHIHILSPMRGKTFLKNEKHIDSKEYSEPLATPKGILCRDYDDVQRADLIIANVQNVEAAIVGTTMEIAWAKMLGKPIILVVDETSENYCMHPMIKESVNFIVDSLDDAINIAVEILLPK